MPRSANRRLDALMATGELPSVRRTQNRSSLVLGGRALMINGRVTAAGQAYERRTGTSLEQPPMWQGDPQIVGRSTYINVTGAWRRRLLTMVDGNETLTNLGRQYYREHPVERIIHVPVRITVLREDGSTYVRPDDTVEVDWTTGLRESQREFRPAMIEQVHAKLGEGYTQSREVVEILYDSQDWRVSTRTVSGNSAEVELEQPLHMPDGRHSFTPFPECVISQAFDDSDNCVIHQLSARLGLPSLRLQTEFEESAYDLYRYETDGFPFGRTGPWTPSFGITARMIRWVAERLIFSAHGFWENRKIVEYVDPSRNRPSVVFSWSNGHLSLMDGEAVQHLSQRRVSPTPSWPILLRVDRDSAMDDQKVPALTEWDMWIAPAEWSEGNYDTPPPAGLFYVDTHEDLFRVRVAFIKAGRVPKARFSDLSCMSSFTYFFSRRESTEKKRCTVRVISPLSVHLAGASGKLGIDYRLEGLGAWMLRAFRLTLQGKRDIIPTAQRQSILARQRHKCLVCSATFSDETPPEFHHETPVAAAITQIVLRALCGPCHAEITAAQGRHRATAESHLSDELWHALVDGPAPRSLVLQVNKPPKRECCYVDRRRSRQAILLESSYKWPVFLPNDEIQPFDGTLGDFVYIVHEATSAQQLVDEAPLRGTGWYHRSVAQAAYEAGVLQPSQITHVVKASVHLSPKIIAKAYQSVLDTLPVEHVSVNGGVSDLRRESERHLIGMWGRKNSDALTSTTSQTPQDEFVHGHGVTYRQFAGVSGWFDFFSACPVSSRHTYYLLYRKIIDEESALVFRLMRSLTITRLFEINTDSLLYEGELPGLRDDVRSEMTTERRLKGVYQLPTRSDPAPRPVAPWRDVGEAEAEAHVLNGGSLIVEALAGCGKSTFLRKMAVKLRAQNKTVHMMALTHVAVANLEDEKAMTLARWTHAYGQGIKNRPDVVIVDELSFVCPFLYSHMATLLQHAQCQCIFAGDWNQLPPVGNVYLGTPVGTMRDKPFLKERCGGTRLMLTERRRNDARLFDFYAGLTRTPMSLADAVALAKQAFPAIEGQSPVNLVGSHSRRVRLNEALQEHFKPAGAVLVNPERASNARKNVPQPMFVWPGLPLICAVRCGGLRNQWSYIVREIHETHAVVIPDKGREPIKIAPLSRLADWFRLPFARTYHSAQGLGFDRVRLWDTEAEYFTLEHLVTGLSRCTQAATVDFGTY